MKNKILLFILLSLGCTSTIKPESTIIQSINLNNAGIAAGIVGILSFCVASYANEKTKALLEKTDLSDDATTGNTALYRKLAAASACIYTHSMVIFLTSLVIGLADGSIKCFD